MLSHGLRHVLFVRKPFALTYVGSNLSTSDLTTYTFAAEPIGTPFLDRLVVVAFMGSVGASNSLSSATIGGVSATLTQSAGTNNSAGLAYARVPTGATADIVLTFSTALLRCGIGVFTITGQRSDTPYATSTPAGGGDTARTATLDVPAGGGVIATAGTGNLSGIAWSGTAGAVEQFDTTPEGGAGHGGAMITSTTLISAATIIATDCRDIAAASWR